MNRIEVGLPTPDGLVALLPVAQLYARDVPALAWPVDSDLLQVLWCPFDHGVENMPKATLHWRSAASVDEVLTVVPEPEAVQYGDYVPEPCLLEPEQVAEYPTAVELPGELRARVREWSARQKAGAASGSDYEGEEEYFYDRELSGIPGWKVGGWSPWSVTDPRSLYCAVCGTIMRPLLTIASYEWKPGGDSSTPVPRRLNIRTPRCCSDRGWRDQGVPLLRSAERPARKRPARPAGPPPGLRPRRSPGGRVTGCRPA